MSSRTFFGVPHRIKLGAIQRWTILDACGKDINNIVSDGAINYVRNISDINTCRIPALCSMGKMLSNNFEVLRDIYSQMPKKLQLLVDIFSIDREYLFGGNKNQIISLPLIRELMQTMRDAIIKILPEKRSVQEKISLNSEEYSSEGLFEEFAKNSHAIDEEVYKKFVKGVFKRFIVDVLTATYSETDGTTIVDNLLHKELKNFSKYSVLPEETHVDNYIHERSRHPLDLEETSGTSVILNDVNINASYDSLAKQIVELQRSLNISDKFDPWETADYINEHGISPTHSLTGNELVLVEAILNAHNKERFDYAKGRYLVDEIDTRFAYYREREFMRYIRSFCSLYEYSISNIFYDYAGQTVDVVADKEISVLDFYNYTTHDWLYETDPNVSIIRERSEEMSNIVGEEEVEPHFIPIVSEDDFYVNPDYRLKQRVSGELLDRSDALAGSRITNAVDIICDKLTTLVFEIHYVRNQLKRQAQFNAMRGTGSLLAHAINDWLLVSFPFDNFSEITPKWAPKSTYAKTISSLGTDIAAIRELNAQIDENQRLFRNYMNVSVVEYMDTTEYFNILPTPNTDENDYSLSARYWEETLNTLTDRDEAQSGVFSPNEIREFYRDSLSMNTLHSTTEVKDDVEEFLISLYESGATDISVDETTSGGYVHPINDQTNDDSLFAYSSKSDRAKVQNNDELQKKQELQHLRYTGNSSLNRSVHDAYDNMGDIINAFNWKNVRYSSVMLHPFLYTFELWNPLVNIIINAYANYSTIDLERNITNKLLFDDLFGLYGETKNFWKYNVLDCSGYMTRYEHEKHSSVDVSNEVSRDILPVGDFGIHKGIRGVTL